MNTRRSKRLQAIIKTKDIENETEENNEELEDETFKKLLDFKCEKNENNDDTIVVHYLTPNESDFSEEFNIDSEIESKMDEQHSNRKKNSPIKLNNIKDKNTSVEKSIQKNLEEEVARIESDSDLEEEFEMSFNPVKNKMIKERDVDVKGKDENDSVIEDSDEADEDDAPEMLSLTTSRELILQKNKEHAHVLNTMKEQRKAMQKQREIKNKEKKNAVSFDQSNIEKVSETKITDDNINKEKKNKKRSYENFEAKIVTDVKKNTSTNTARAFLQKHMFGERVSRQAIYKPFEPKSKKRKH